MKILVLTAFYPMPGGTHERMFVHVRNRYYQSHGIDVTVLNFAAHEDYEIDGISVITMNTYGLSADHYDIVISHSANLRNHYQFLKKHQQSFEHLVFFFHGHEMLYLTRDYPRPYSYDKAGKWYRRALQYGYDKLKISLWKRFYKELAPKSEFVFVSEWLFNRFQRNTGLSAQDLKNHCHIINNSVSKEFEVQDYSSQAERSYDFITIRANIDGSKYCIDLVTEFAAKNPNMRFLLIGEGNFFNHYARPENLKWVSKTLSHEEMLQYINASKYALMPTREDTQGVMSCELVTFGIPLITSDIDVCHEFFNDVEKVTMVENNPVEVDLVRCLESKDEVSPMDKCKKWFAEYTILREIELLRKIMNTSSRS